MAKYHFNEKYFLEDSVNDFLFIITIRSTAQPELLLRESRGKLMMNSLIQNSNLRLKSQNRRYRGLLRVMKEASL